MKKVVVLLLLWGLLAVNKAYAYQWAETFGGTAGDIANSVQQTADGGYIVAGYCAMTRIVGSTIMNRCTPISLPRWLRHAIRNINVLSVSYSTTENHSTR